MRQQLTAVLSRDKSVENATLNRLGVQVARTVAARGLWHARYLGRNAGIAAAPEVRALVRAVETEGFVEVPDFLTPEDFAAACDEAQRLLGGELSETRVVRTGSNTLFVVDVKARAQNGPGIDAFFSDPRLVATMEGLERRPLEGAFGSRTLERLVQDEGEPDEQADLHSDTFFTVHKAWLYLTDVTEQDGPLEYVPRSNRLSPTQLAHVYRESCGPNFGSRRILAGEVAARGLQPRVFLCRRNTLVIANTMGYHRRRQGRPPGDRITLHLSVRANPFSSANFRVPHRNHSRR